jgi:hypothetical protein
MRSLRKSSKQTVGTQATPRRPGGRGRREFLPRIHAEKRKTVAAPKSLPKPHLPPFFVPSRIHPSAFILILSMIWCGARNGTTPFSCTAMHTNAQPCTPFGPHAHHCTASDPSCTPTVHIKCTPFWQPGQSAPTHGLMPVQLPHPRISNLQAPQPGWLAISCKTCSASWGGGTRPAFLMCF